MHKWVSVTTVHAPAWLVQLHANYMRRIGAAKSFYFIDQPGIFSEEEVAALAQCATLVFCDEEYWKKAGGRPERHPERQLKNVAFARAAIAAKWFLHIDIDEFPFFGRAIETIIDGAPQEMAEIRLPNVERVIIRGSRFWHDGVLRVPNFDKELQLRLYGPKARFLGAGLANYTHGKSLVANRPQIVQGIHGAMHAAGREIVRTTVELSQGYVAHYPCICPQHLFNRVRKNLGSQDSNVRKFRHEHLQDQFAFGNNASAENATRALLMMHLCTPEEARAWTNAGLCTRMPESYLELLKAAAAQQEWLEMSFADRSFREFFGTD